MENLKAAGLFECAVSEISKKQEPGKNDYIKDGLIYCGVCHTPRQIRETFKQLGDKEYILPVACECRKRKLEADRIKEIADQREAYRKKALPYAAYREMTCEKSDKPLDIVRRYTDKWAKILAENIGIMFYGPPGSGKTYVAAAIANRLIDRNTPCIYMDNITGMTAMMADLYGGDRDKCMEIIKYSDLLIIDDLGVERLKEFEQQNVYTIIEARIETKKPLIVTTNLTPKAMAETPIIQLQRIYSRLSSLHPIEIRGDDHRKADTIAKYSAVNKLLMED